MVTEEKLWSSAPLWQSSEYNNYLVDGQEGNYSDTVFRHWILNM